VADVDDVDMRMTWLTIKNYKVWPERLQRGQHVSTELNSLLCVYPIRMYPPFTSVLLGCSCHSISHHCTTVLLKILINIRILLVEHKGKLLPFAICE
jgi:hypothetical protein